MQQMVPVTIQIADCPGLRVCPLSAHWKQSPSQILLCLHGHSPPSRGELHRHCLLNPAGQNWRWSPWQRCTGLLVGCNLGITQTVVHVCRRGDLSSSHGILTFPEHSASVVDSILSLTRE